MQWAPYGRYTGFDNLSPLQWQFYNDGDQGSRVAYDQFIRGIGLQGGLRNYAQSQYGDLQNQFLAYTFAQPDPTKSMFTDWLQSQGGNLLNSYNMLPSKQRGVNLGSFNAGRIMW